MLTVLDALPEGFLSTPARELHRILPGPTLIRLPGRRQPALFVSVLLHGNEDSGWTGLQQVLRECAGRPLPRALTVLVGNVQAAREGLRRLDGQPDFNRVWPGTVEHARTAEAAAMEHAWRLVMEDGLVAAVDLHNNTGLNPHYSVVCRLDQASLHLARLFSRTVVWFRGLAGTQTACFAPHVPAVALECGKPGHEANARACARFISAALELAEFPAHAVREQDIDLYHSVAIVRVRPDVGFTFGEGPAEVSFDPRLDHMNFRELDPGAAWGHSRHPMPLDVRDEADADVAHRYFSTEGGVLRLQRAAMPAMLTLDERVVRQDCLCYLMERVAFERVEQARPGG
ncbi:MAG: peptidase M14 [Burkholderiales bacterium]|nr:MAG: peptidase M14 [Burkholderiales bacterium]